jgi:hypothetical protein
VYKAFFVSRFQLRIHPLDEAILKARSKLSTVNWNRRDNNAVEPPACQSEAVEDSSSGQATKEKLNH